MNVIVSGRRTTISDSLRQQAEEKIGRLDKFLSGLEKAEVHFWEEHVAARDHREFCEVTLQGHGHHVRCKVSAPDGFTAVDLAVDKLERQLRKLKSKVTKNKRAKEKMKLEAEVVPESLVDPREEIEPVYQIVKSKAFMLEAMNSQQASLQMDLLNHSFYMFINAETAQPAVVYRRDDGNIGLIDAN